MTKRVSSISKNEDNEKMDKLVRLDISDWTFVSKVKDDTVGRLERGDIGEVKEFNARADNAVFAFKNAKGESSMYAAKTGLKKWLSQTIEFRSEVDRDALCTVFEKIVLRQKRVEKRCDELNEKNVKLMRLRNKELGKRMLAENMIRRFKKKFDLLDKRLGNIEDESDNVDAKGLEGLGLDKKLDNFDKKLDQRINSILEALGFILLFCFVFC